MMNDEAVGGTAEDPLILVMLQQCRTSADVVRKTQRAIVHNLFEGDRGMLYIV